MYVSFEKRKYAGLWLAMYQSQNDILHSQTGLKKSDILKISYNHKPGMKKQKWLFYNMGGLWIIRRY